MAIKNNNTKNEFEALANDTNTEFKAALNAMDHAPAVDNAAPNYDAFTQPQPQPTFANANAGMGQPQPQDQYAAMGINVGSGLLSQGMEFDVPYNLAGGKVQAFFNKFEEMANSHPALKGNRQSWDLLIFDGASRQTNGNAIIFARKSGAYAAFFTLLIAETVPEFQDMVYNNQNYGGTINIPRLPEEIITTETYFSENVTEFVKSTLATKGVAEAIFVDALVIPAELTPENEAQLNSILMNANAAAESMLFKLMGKPRRLSLLQRRPNEVLSLRYDYHLGKLQTAVGFPVRSDVAIKLSVQESNKGNNSPLGTASSTTFSVTSGYMQLQYTGQTAPNYAAMQQMGPWAAMNPQLFQSPLFQPIFVINRLENQFSQASLETQLLALATVGSLSNNNNWVQCFAPNWENGASGTDPKDIGNITKDVNFPGEPLAITDTKTKEFDLYKHVARYLHPTLMFYLDVPELGELSYLQRIFLEAAGTARNGNKVSNDVQMKANQIIFDAAQWLTGGKFGNYFKQGTPVVIDEVSRVELGYYVDEAGNMRDLHEIDYLSLIVKCEDDIEVARRYMDSLNPATDRDIARFQRRLDIYRTFFPSFKITGWARRLTVNPEFLQALGSALADVGGNMVIEMVNHQYTQQVDRAFHSKVGGIAMNGINGFVQNYFGGFGAGGPGANVWQYTVAPAASIYSMPAQNVNYAAQAQPQYNYGTVQGNPAPTAAY